MNSGYESRIHGFRSAPQYSNMTSKLYVGDSLRPRRVPGRKGMNSHLEHVVMRVDEACIAPQRNQAVTGREVRGSRSALGHPGHQIYETKGERLKGN